jgi:4-hydroxyphenylpyruvate dioxygenase
MGTPLVELAAAAAGAGFASISITPPMYFAARSTGLSDADLRQLLSDQGVSVSLLDPLLTALPGMPSPSVVGSTFRSLFEVSELECYQVAEALEIPSINVAHYLGAPVGRDELVDAFGALCDRAAGRGVGVLLEFMPDGAIPDLPAALDIVRTAAPLTSAVMLDTWHFFRTGGHPDDLERCRPGEIGGVQVSDAGAAIAAGSSPGLYARELPGEGVIPLAEILAGVLARHADPFVGIEVFNRQLAGRPAAEVALKAAAAMSGITRGAA